VRAVIAPDKFRGSLSAAEAARAIERGLARALHELEVVVLPMADGGEGTVDAFLATGDWTAREVAVRGPLGDPVRARFALRGDTAVCEMASASGRDLLAPGDDRGARLGSSFGTGQLVRAALDAGARRIILGIGGTATNDAGAGALVALGARLFDRRGAELALGGAALGDLHAIDLAGLDPLLLAARIDLATDVDTILLGERGATAVFGPQKGATPGDVPMLDKALKQFADTLVAAGGTDARADAGSGAGGGIPFAFRAVTDARIGGGFALVSELVHLERAIAGAAVCFTGEGSIDDQTLSGKVVYGVARIAARHRKRAYAFAGRVDPHVARELATLGCEATAIVDASVPHGIAMRDAARFLERAAESIGRRLAASA
jgi:glycerate kinase